MQKGIIVEKPRDNGKFISGFSYSPNTQIKPGERISPATEFMIGEHRSKGTEFKSGQEAHNKLPVGTETIRIYKNKPRVWLKIAEPNKWKLKAVHVWESINGPLTKGYTVHHKDHNSLNDLPENLQSLSRRDHIKEHRRELQAWFRGE